MDMRLRECSGCGVIIPVPELADEKPLCDECRGLGEMATPPGASPSPADRRPPGASPAPNPAPNPALDATRPVNRRPSREAASRVPRLLLALVLLLPVGGGASIAWVSGGPVTTREPSIPDDPVQALGRIIRRGVLSVRREISTRPPERPRPRPR